MSAYQINTLDLDDVESIRGCFRLLAVLRPHLVESEFVKRVQVQAREGYQIAHIVVNGEPVAAAGYRFANFLAWGKVLYVDDLITHPQQKNKGLAGTIMDWLVAEAARNECDAVHLDTGYERHDAHRLYLNKGFKLSSHHMVKKLR